MELKRYKWAEIKTTTAYYARVQIISHGKTSVLVQYYSPEQHKNGEIKRKIKEAVIKMSEIVSFRYYKD